MRRSWPIWIGGAVVVTLLVFVPFRLGLLSSGSGPTWANFERLAPGMTTEEVEGLLGPPALDLDPADVPIPPNLWPWDAAIYEKEREILGRIKRWQAKDGITFSGYFDKAGRLIRKGSRNPNRANQFP